MSVTPPTACVSTCSDWDQTQTVWPQGIQNQGGFLAMFTSWQPGTGLANDSSAWLTELAVAVEQQLYVTWPAHPETTETIPELDVLSEKTEEVLNQPVPVAED